MLYVNKFALMMMSWFPLKTCSQVKEVVNLLMPCNSKLTIMEQRSQHNSPSQRTQIDKTAQESLHPAGPTDLDKPTVTLGCMCPQEDVVDKNSKKLLELTSELSDIIQKPNVAAGIASNAIGINESTRSAFV